MNAKDRAWKKHTETRVTFLRNLKIYIDNRQNTCANKDMYKKCIKLYKYLNKIHKNNDVSKFVKTLQNLKDIVKEWDYLVTEKVAHIGKVCGAFYVEKRRSNLFVFIENHIDNELKNDPDNYTYEVVPKLKPGLNTDSSVDTGVNTRVPTVSDSSVVQEARNQARDDIARRVTTRLDTLDEKREHTNVNNIVVQEAKNQARDDVASRVATRLDTHDQKGQTNVNNIVVNGVNSDTSTKPPLIHLYNTEPNANMFQNQDDDIDRDRLAAMYV